MRHVLVRLLIAAVVLAVAACSAAAPGASLPIVPSGLATASPSGDTTTPWPSATTSATPTPSASALATATQTSQCAGISPFSVTAAGPFAVVAEFQLTPAEFLAWHDQFIRATGVNPGHPGPGVSPWPFTTGGDRPVTVCYLSGDFATHGSSPPSGTPDPDEAVVVLNGSTVELIAVGSQEGLPLVTPTPD